MTSLFDHWDTIEKKFRRARGRGLFLFDYDGTLTPIVRNPRRARLSPRIRASLRALAKHPACQVAIVSGRSVADIRKHVRLAGLAYVGNHGYEIDSPTAHFVHPIARAKAKRLAALAARLARTFGHVPGVYIENKRYTLSIHYRNVPARLQPRTKSHLEAETALIAAREGLSVRAGKKVIEIRPNAHWHKGEAVRRLRRAGPSGAMTLYIGDDTTDEDAFRALGRQAISIRVGKSASSAARYYLRGIAETPELLRRLVRLAA